MGCDCQLFIKVNDDDHDDDTVGHTDRTTDARPLRLRLPLDAASVPMSAISRVQL